MSSLRLLLLIIDAESQVGEDVYQTFTLYLDDVFRMLDL